MSPTAMSTVQSAAPTLSDEHSVLLWQACTYADDLIDAAHSGKALRGPHDAMLEFAHYRLLPYLAAEEGRLPAVQLRDNHLEKVLLDDHERIRSGVENIETGRTRQLLAIAADALVDRLDRHVRREETWVAHDGPMLGDPALCQNWALPLLLCDEIAVDALPEEGWEALIMQRLAWMRSGETLRLDAGRDLHSLWRDHHRLTPDTYVWVYEKDGPARWRVRITRRISGSD